MKNYVIHCKDKDNLKKAVDMLADILLPIATKIQDRKIETVTGSAIVFVTNDNELRGLKAKGYICVDDTNIDSDTEFKLKLTSIY